MKFGYSTGYWSAGPPEGVVAAIAECDRLGFEHVWTAEAYGSDAITPLAYLAAHRWLQDFAFRIDIPWGIFLLAGLSALLIAVLTVSFQSIRAALANPVETLRHE